jgi:hypothetical protein
LINTPNLFYLDFPLILKENQDKIDWVCLSSNRNAMPILKENQDKIVWRILSLNPSIFKIKFNEDVYKELIEAVYHPRRFIKYLFEYDYDIGSEENNE